MKNKETILVLLLLLLEVNSFQLDEIEAEPFLEVSDTYMKEQKLTPWFGKEHLSANEKFTVIK